VAVEYERVFAAEAKKRQEQAAVRGNQSRHDDSPVVEICPNRVSARLLMRLVTYSKYQAARSATPKHIEQLVVRYMRPILLIFWDIYWANV
jgi:hypothetical protein